MKRGIITAGNHESGRGFIFKSLKDESFVDTEAKKIWEGIKSKLGYPQLETSITFEKLFSHLHDVFVEQFGTDLHVTYQESYILVDESTPLKHSEAPRIFSTKRLVYFDSLMASVLFTYSVIFYSWARYEEDQTAYGFCFKYALYIFNELCRKGNLPSEEGNEKMFAFIEKMFDTNALEFTSDLYWCMIAFSICHELAHIYLEHHESSDIEQEWQKEYEADAKAFDVFLMLIQRQKEGKAIGGWQVFQEYLYAAPMVMLLFYDCVFTVGFWMFGEQIPKTHPPIHERIDRLLEQSLDDKYVMDTEEGNTTLGNYWNTVDLFKEELFYKLKNGKLEEIFRKGASNMKGNGYEEAVEFDKAMCDELRIIAQEKGLDPGKLVGLWDSAMEVNVEGIGEARGFIWTVRDKTYSSKSFNVFLRLERILVLIIENGLTFSIPQSKPLVIQMALNILFQLAKASTIEITEEQCVVLNECHSRKAYEHGIAESELIGKLPNVTAKTINDLAELHCIRIEDGLVFLNEKVVL